MSLKLCSSPSSWKEPGSWLGNWHLLTAQLMFSCLQEDAKVHFGLLVKWAARFDMCHVNKACQHAVPFVPEEHIPEQMSPWAVVVSTLPAPLKIPSSVLQPVRVRGKNALKVSTLNLACISFPNMSFFFSPPFFLFQLISIDELDNAEVLISFSFKCPMVMFPWHFSSELCALSPSLGRV